MAGSCHARRIFYGKVAYKLTLRHCNYKAWVLTRHKPFGIASGIQFHTRTNAEPEGEGSRQAKFVTWLGLWVNLGLFSLKGAIGYLSGSASLIADAMHSAS